MVPTNPYAHVNDDLSIANETRRKKQRRCLMSILIISGIAAVIIILFSVTALRFRTPKFRVRSANSFQTFNVSNSTSNPSFNIAMNTEFGIKNTNFRRFWYRSTTVDFFYREQKVGDVFIWNERVKARDTRKFTVPVTLSSMNLSNFTSSTELGSDLNGGVLPLSSRARLTGKFKILFVFRKYKHVNMDCTMDLVIASRVLRNISCR